MSKIHFNKGLKNILMLHGGADLYGGSKILLQTAKILFKNGFNVIVVVDSVGPLIKELEKEGLIVLIAELGILRRRYFNPRGLINRVKALFKSRKFLIDIILKHQIDLVYSNTTSVLIGCYVAKQRKLPHIWHIHEIIKNPRFFTKFISWHLNKFADKIIVVSEEVRKHWNQHVDNSKIITIYNGLDYSNYLNSTSGLRKELGISKEKVIIGMIGRVNLWKGQKYFLEMAAKIVQKYPQSVFVLVGDAYPGYEYLYEEINLFIRNNQLEFSTYNLGYRTDVPFLLASFDLFILPSIEPDPLPTVVLEAMASSKPVIATAHGGALEMVLNNSTGIHIPWDDASEAISRFEWLIEDKIQRQVMGENAKTRALSSFSQEEYEKNIINLISSSLR